MFKGRHFDRSIILLCVRWYLAYRLSLREAAAAILVLASQQAAFPTGHSLSIDGGKLAG